MRKLWRPDKCPNCGGDCAPCKDNFGANYMGCKVCVVRYVPALELLRLTKGGAR